MVLMETEKIPQVLVAEAVKHVPVGDYFKLRYQFKTGRFSSEEYGQMSSAVKVIKDFDPGDKIEPSINPVVIGSRTALKAASLPEYLSLRNQTLVQEMSRIIRQRDEGRALDRDVLSKLVGEQYLVVAAANAAGIKLDADFSK